MHSFNALVTLIKFRIDEDAAWMFVNLSMMNFCRTRAGLKASRGDQQEE